MNGKLERRRALIVYPPGATTRAVREVLEAQDLDVREAANVFSAVGTFATEPADLVVLGLSGLEDSDLRAIPALREREPRVFVLVSFPPELRSLAVSALARGADAYLLEPFYLGELADLAARGLARAGSSGGPAAPPPPGGPRSLLAEAVADAVNNPLQILELMIDEDAPPIERGDIVQEVRRIAEVVAQLLVYAGREDLTTGPVDLNGLVREAAPSRGGRKRPVVHELDPDLPMLQGDENLLRLTLRTLTALAAGRGEPSPLTVRTALVGQAGAEQVTVRFEGPHLLRSADERRAFEEPFGADRAGALDLAAAAVRAAVARHGGSVDLPAQQDGANVVVVRLPLTRAAARRS